MRRLNRYKVLEIWWLSGIENFVSERNDFIFNSFRNFRPVKRLRNRSDVLEFWSLDNSSSKSILDVLETIYLIFWKTVVQGVAVVKLGVYD